MAYAQDTINDVNAANVLALVLDGLLIDAGWTVVETLTPAGTNTPNTKVYLSDSAINQCGYDWYVALMWKGVGTEAQVEVIAGGAYDIGTHRISQMPNGLSPRNVPGFNGWSEAVTGDNWGYKDVNVATGVGTTATSTHSGATSQTKPWFATVVPSSAFAYWASITLDHVSIYTTILPANGSPWMFAATLDVDVDWAALGFPVAVNPVIGYTSVGAGISAAVIGTGSTIADYRRPLARYARDVGSPLPILSGTFLPAYAWRDTWYLDTLEGAGSGFDGPVFGDGFHIGDGIDFYRVYGGSLGDTVEIAAATYVLSGLITASGSLGVYIACLVE